MKIEPGLYRYDHVADRYRHNTYWLLLTENLVIYNIDVKSDHRKFTFHYGTFSIDKKHDIVTDCFTGVRV